jgi:hypothetical protein
LSVSDGHVSLTQLAIINDIGSDQLAIYAADIPTAAGGTTPTITLTVDRSSTLAIVAQEISGLAPGNTTAMLDGSVVYNEAQSKPSLGTGPYSSTASNEYLITAYADDGGPDSWSSPSGYTLDSHNSNGSGAANLAIAYNNSSNGPESAKWSISSGTDPPVEYAAIVAFKLPSGSTMITAAMALHSMTSGSLLLLELAIAGAIMLPVLPRRATRRRSLRARRLVP